MLRVLHPGPVLLGQRGRNVIMQQSFAAPTVVNSGVVVAKAIELVDGEDGALTQMCVFDPAKVTRNAMQCTASVAAPVPDRSQPRPRTGALPHASPSRLTLNPLRPR